MQTCTIATRCIQNTSFSAWFTCKRRPLRSLWQALRSPYNWERSTVIKKIMKGEGHMVFHLVPITRLHVCQCVLCAECLRPWVLHSKHKLFADDRVVLKRTLEDILFSCGLTLKDVKLLTDPSDNPQTKSLFERVFVGKNLNCEMPLEVTHYSAECFEDLCVHCACNKDLTFTTGVYPICSYCVNKGKTNVFKRKRPLFEPAKQSSKKTKKWQFMFIYIKVVLFFYQTLCLCALFFFSSRYTIDD